VRGRGKCPAQKKHTPKAPTLSVIIGITIFFIVDAAPGHPLAHHMPACPIHDSARE
jgi:hypothetical protein